MHSPESELSLLKRYSLTQHLSVNLFYPLFPCVIFQVHLLT
uniref:Uncharacterized protein n=1 Tax=Anguilla anguilla TaxID=7936 RepID=A0A0E9WHD9_ANGAN